MDGWTDGRMCCPERETKVTDAKTDELRYDEWCGWR